MSTSPRKAPEQGALLEVAATEKPERTEQPKEASGRFVSPRPFRPWQPEQGQLLPQYTRQVLGEGHLACFFADLAEVLDFSPILKAHTQQCGQPAYHPVMMAVVLKQQGLSVNRKRVQRLMGLEGMALGPNTSRPQPEHPVFPLPAVQPGSGSA